MTPDEAGRVMKIATAGAVARDLEPERFAFLIQHLLPLPYERTRDNVHRYVANNKWISSLEELCDAAGLPDDDPRAGVRARTDLTIAVREGGRLVSDLRAVSGWSYVAPGAALPPGAVEAEQLRAAPVAALPAGQEITEEQRRENLRRLGGLFREFGKGKAS